MIQFRNTAQAINNTQAEAAFGLVAVADINHRDLHRDSMSPCCSGKRRHMSKRPYSGPSVPVRPVYGPGTPAGQTTPPLWRTGQAGGHAARLWATLVLQRALSS